ncbi:putative sporulation protein YtxC [Alkalihalobacillus sp. LMS39]|uniref:putative sporulation protein YtxC n=1 Tax=Alkalihalobacillus sp. LMS39 TaxID=2924032 RepID=UPI001FB2966B|nr:putative sporulation protein YtxC [Alkalihalobacillus sp. LMS39]UOE93400.1 putative sporulation protein YtxC [Alkalihalobacillus sp. LMS39]
MISIHFESQDDCQIIYSKLKRHMELFEQLGGVGTISCEGLSKILIEYNDTSSSFYDSFHPLLVSIFTNHVIDTKEEEWLCEIIETLFYFSDHEEQKQISMIAKEILEGDREDIPSVSKFFNRDALLYKAFSRGFDRDTIFYYEPFLTFRLKEYGEMLIDCVEVAIDEYLLEQEYQNIVEGLRYYLQSVKPKRKVIHLVHDQKFLFYNEQFQKMTRREKKRLLENDLVYEGEIDIDDMVVSPLVSMSPEQVHIYTDEIDNDVVLTIQTIFQERVSIHSRQWFSVPKAFQ